MYLVDDEGETFTSPYLACSTRPGTATIRRKHHDVCFKLARPRKAATAFSFSPSHMAASLPWPMSRMR